MIWVQRADSIDSAIAARRAVDGYPSWLVRTMALHHPRRLGGHCSEMSGCRTFRRHDTVFLIMIPLTAHCKHNSRALTLVQLLVRIHHGPSPPVSDIHEPTENQKTHCSATHCHSRSNSKTKTTVPPKHKSQRKPPHPESYALAHYTPDFGLQRHTDTLASSSLHSPYSQSDKTT